MTEYTEKFIGDLIVGTFFVLGSWKLVELIFKAGQWLQAHFDITMKYIP